STSINYYMLFTKIDFRGNFEIALAFFWKMCYTVYSSAALDPTSDAAKACAAADFEMPSCNIITAGGSYETTRH
ncbi:MAG: hypothetical protein LUC50_05135, partial [Ruminococcus sp.]|nr:hypothetical protein [Ruminococcus sp.]